MKKDIISTKKNVEILKSELAVFHKNNSFLELKTMGDVLNKHLEISLKIEILSKAT
ncbi:MAG: hypothetical protein ACJAXI_001055 [Crocinitomicaceae bacterium]|jgi:hypothetical protein